MSRVLSWAKPGQINVYGDFPELVGGLGVQGLGDLGDLGFGGFRV